MSAWLRALALGAAAAAFALAIGAPLGALPAALAAFAGALAADALPARLRPGGVACAAACAWAGLALARAIGSGAAGAGAWTAEEALRAVEWLRWVSATGPIVFALRCAARSSAFAAIAELSLGAAALALPLAAHRGGSLHRPLEIGDWAGVRGIDPALPFLISGAVAASALAAVLLRPARPARLALRALTTSLVAAAALALLHQAGARAPEASRALGLAGVPSPRPDGAPEAESAADTADLTAPDSGSGDAAPVAIALLHGDWSPPGGILYFRQSALSQWNGARLVRTSRLDADTDVYRAFPAEGVLRSRAAPPPGARRALDTTLGLLVDHVAPFALDSPRELEAIANPAPERFLRAYRARSEAPTRPWAELLGDRAGNPAWPAEVRREYTRGPQDPRYSELARRIVSELRAEHARDPLAQAFAIKAWLEREGVYRRDARHTAAADPVAAFLFGERIGYCAHFAHATALLLRSLGLPARVALGYAVPDASRAGGSALLIRGADAHAWAELYLESAGWVPIDASPRQARAALAPPPDLGLQRRLAELLRRPAPAPDAPGPTPIGVGGRELVALLLASLALSAAPGPWRRLAPRIAHPRQRWRLTYRAALDRLAEVGLVRRRGETRERFAERAAALSPSFAVLTRAHLRAALGGDARTDDPLAPLALYTEMRREICGRAPAWRRWLGRLDPWTWRRAR